ncbi:MltA domain-containing protein [Planctomycetota bacterium]
MRNKILLLLLLAFFLLTLTSCRTTPVPVELAYNKPLPPGQFALKKITDPVMIPNFTAAGMNRKDLKTAVDKSLNYLSKPSSRAFFPSGQITYARTVMSLLAFSELLDSNLTAGQLNAAIREKFDVYMSVGCDDSGTVLFTGYYTPIFDGSFTRSENFQYPLYKQPKDLVKTDDGKILGRRTTTGRITKYPSRAAIEDADMLQGNELIWLTDPFEAYIAHVQGSAKIKTPDGNLIGLGYAANNGHEYRGISKVMLRDGAITPQQMSLAAMIDYFKQHIDQVARYTRRNPRFVFFKTQQGPPRGSLNEPVTKMRTIATDKSIFPRAALTFIQTYVPQSDGQTITHQIYSGFALDQDTGGAIRAPGRCDIYMGKGDLAGKLAGQTYREGRLYYLFLKSKR